MTNPTPRRAHRFAGAAALIATLAGCGGGGTDGAIDPRDGSPDAPLFCAGGKCVESNTLATSDLHARFFVLDDGHVVQGQAGFLDHDGSNYNVELNGDTSYLVDGATTSRMGTANEGCDSFHTCPYIANDTAARTTAAHAYQIKLVRPGGTYLASGTVPAPFSIALPAQAGLADASATFSLSVDASTDPQIQVQTATCSRPDGSSAEAMHDGAGDAFTRVDGTHYLFSITRFLADIDQAQYGYVYCSVMVNVRIVATGTVDPALPRDSTMTVYQTRAATIALE